MTACVNKNHGRRVAGVVTASLVGALTLGGVSLAAVPTVALAEQGSLEFAKPDTNVATATDVTFLVGNSPKTLGDHNVLFKWGDVSDTTVSVKSFKPQGSNTTITLGEDADPDTNTDAYKNYRITVSEADADGNATSTVKDNRIVKPGKYQVKIEVLSDAQVVEQTYSADFTVSGKDFSQYTKAWIGDTEVFGNTHVTFSGEAQKVSFKYWTGKNSAGEDTYADLAEGADYTVAYDKQGEGSVKEVKGHGTYTAHLTGLGEFEGSTWDVTFTVDAFDAHSTLKWSGLTVGGQVHQGRRQPVRRHRPHASLERAERRIF